MITFNLKVCPECKEGTLLPNLNQIFTGVTKDKTILNIQTYSTCPICNHIEVVIISPMRLNLEKSVMVNRIFLSKSNQSKDFDEIYVIYKHDEINKECKAQTFIRCGGCLCDWYNEDLFENLIDVSHLYEQITNGYGLIENFNEIDANNIFKEYDKLIKE